MLAWPFGWRNGTDGLQRPTSPVPPLRHLRSYTRTLKATLIFPVLLLHLQSPFIPQRHTSLSSDPSILFTLFSPCIPATTPWFIPAVYFLFPHSWHRFFSLWSLLGSLITCVSFTLLQTVCYSLCIFPPTHRLSHLSLAARPAIAISLCCRLLLSLPIPLLRTFTAPTGRSYYVLFCSLFNSLAFLYRMELSELLFSFVVRPSVRPCRQLLVRLRRPVECA